MAETLIHGEMRVVDDAPEMWVKLDDVLEWLRELPVWTNHVIAASVALEIREMLIQAVGRADLVPSDD
jgi:hypothetical protein